MSGLKVFLRCWLCLASFGAQVSATGLSNLKIEDFYLCEEIAEHKLKLFIHPRNFNPGSQLVDMNMTLPVAVGNDATAQFLLEVETQIGNKRSWIHVFNMEGDTCKMLDRYAGEFWYRMETGMGIMPRSCPIPRGNYHAVNFVMNHQTLKLQAAPLGKMRLTVKVFLKKHPDIIGCMKIVSSNRD